ncbi:MAG: cation diffusion facilitator family transporter [Spirochaetia bacterium]|nr:cation diffusion facilitator family transporter [Spirochaetia bacterium]
MDSHTSSTKAILYAFSANLGIAVAKGIGAFITGSGSMLAETIHSLADCGNQILLFFGMKNSQKPPTKDHPFGFGKSIYFWSFIVAMMLFSLGGIFSAYEGVKKVQSPEEISNPVIALIILGVSIVLESFSLAGAMKEIKIIRLGKSLGEWIKTTRSAELLVVFAEDAAAILGLILAFIFVVLTILTGNPIFDAIGSICIGIILLIIAFFLMIRIQALIIGRSADPELQGFIENEIKKDKNILEIFNVITLQMGAQIMLSAKIRMNEKLTIKQACIAINTLEVKIKNKFPEIRWSFIEPDIKN